MWTLLTIIGLYAIGMGFFRLLGGFGSAGEAMRSWGEAATRLDTRRASSTA